MDTSNYRKRAHEIFLKFKTAIENPNDGSVADEKSFWRFGCTFDSMTDYLLTLKNSKHKDDLKVYADYKLSLKKQLSTTNWNTRVDPYAQYLKTLVKFNGGGCYDDFCWWGIATSKALPSSPYYSLFIDLFGESGTKDFHRATEAIWEVVHNGNYGPIVASVPESYDNIDEFVLRYQKRGTYFHGSPNAWTQVSKDIPAGLKAAYFGTPKSNSPAKVVYVEPRHLGGMWQYDYYWDPTVNEKNPAVMKEIIANNKDCYDRNPTYKGTSSFTVGAAQSPIGQDGNPLVAANRIGPYQLTLISGLMLIYSSRLQSWGANANVQYLTCGKGIKKFLDSWMTEEDSKHKLLWHYNDDEDYALMRERVGVYADGSPIKGYWSSLSQPTNRVWAGDQGLLIGGLTEYAIASGDSDGIDVTIKQLVTGTLNKNSKLNLAATDEEVGGLQHLYPKDLNYGCDNLFCLRDYWTGAGIFWRYLYQTHQSSPVVKEALATLLAEPNNVIVQSANAALKDPQFPWNQGSTNDLEGEIGALFRWFSPLATLTAAISILED